MNPPLKEGVLPGLSLCMIVKNEETYLKGCLESVKSLVDEIIIVDTGSTDKTVEIARSYTSKIYFFEWVHDFAKARNESIKHATREWILYLDADERLPKTYHTPIRNLLNRKEFGAYMLNLKCYSDPKDKSKFEIAVYRRIFKNYKGIQFQGKVHEQIYYSLQKIGAVTGSTDILIEHLGYAVSKDIMDQKMQRNLELIQKNIEEDPEDSYAWHQLSGTYVAMKDYEKAYMPALKAISLPNITPSTKARCYNILGMIAAYYKEFYRCRFFCRESIRLAKVQLQAYYYMADSFYVQGIYEGALRSYLKLQEYIALPQTQLKQSITVDITVPKWHISLMLSKIYDKLSDHLNAIKYAKKALKENQSLKECHYLIAITQTKQHQFKKAEKHLNKLKSKDWKARYLMAMGYLRKEQKKYQEALTIFNRYIKEYPEETDFSQAYLAQSEIYYELKDPKHLTEAVEKFILLSPEENQEKIRLGLYKKYQLGNNNFVQ